MNINTNVCEIGQIDLMAKPGATVASMALEAAKLALAENAAVQFFWNDTIYRVDPGNLLNCVKPIPSQPSES